MTEAAENVPTSEKIRAAEESVARAREVLERAESGLRAVESVTEKAEEIKSHPVRKLFALLVLGGLAAVVIWLVREER